MKTISISGLAFAGLILSGSVVLADDTLRFTQNNAINVKAIIIFDRSDSRDIEVTQNGRYNSVGVVSAGNGGYTDIYQRGEGNRSLIGSFGKNQSTKIEQVMSSTGAFGRMSRR